MMTWLNILVCTFGFLSCIGILVDSHLNKMTANCVIGNCVIGLVWFSFMYSSVLCEYSVTTLEVFLKILLLYFILDYIEGETKHETVNFRGVVYSKK